MPQFKVTILKKETVYSYGDQFVEAASKAAAEAKVKENLDVPDDGWAVAQTDSLGFTVETVTEVSDA